MTQAARKLSFEEYASLDAEDWLRLGLPEGWYEFDDGELIALPPESELNNWLALHLFDLLVQTKITQIRLIRPHSCEVEVPGNPRTRYPDLVILREEHLALTQRRLLITREMPPPQLVVEVVRPGKNKHKRNYTAKCQQYQERGIPEYWLLNPETQTIEVLTLENGNYITLGTFHGESLIQSPTFQTLTLTAAQVFEAGK